MGARVRSRESMFDERDVAFRLAARDADALYWRLLRARVAADAFDDETHVDMLSDAASQLHSLMEPIRSHVDWLDEQPFGVRWSWRRVLAEVDYRVTGVAVGSLVAVVWIWLATTVLVAVL